MAQQTKKGHVYIISNIGSFGEDVFKIGLTRRLDPNERVRELGDASVPFPFDVHAMLASDDAPALETELHRRFVERQVNKINKRKEFFRVSLTELRQVADELGLEASWTLTAEAAQYRETLALEQAMKTDAELKQKWLEEQATFNSTMNPSMRRKWRRLKRNEESHGCQFIFPGTGSRSSLIAVISRGGMGRPGE